MSQAQAFQKPRITREPNSIKGWYCRSPDGRFGFGESPKDAFWDWFLVLGTDRPLLLGKKWVDRNDPIALALVGALGHAYPPVKRPPANEPVEQLPKKQVSFIAKIFGF